MACDRRLGCDSAIAVPDIWQRYRYGPGADAAGPHHQHLTALSRDRSALRQQGRGGHRRVYFQCLAARHLLSATGVARQRDGHVGAAHFVSRHEWVGLAARGYADRGRDAEWTYVRTCGADEGKRHLFCSSYRLSALQAAAGSDELSLRRRLLVLLGGVNGLPVFSVCNTQERAASLWLQLRPEQS